MAEPNNLSLSFIVAFLSLSCIARYLLFHVGGPYGRRSRDCPEKPVYLGSWTWKSLLVPVWSIQDPTLL